MKTRQGFVSNSSSSSFLIYGICLSSYELIEKLKIEGGKELDQTDMCEEIFKKSRGVGLFYYKPDYDMDFIYLGLSWSQIMDDETGRQFKDRVVVLIEEMLGEKLDCDTHEYAWYNG